MRLIFSKYVNNAFSHREGYILWSNAFVSISRKYLFPRNDISYHENQKFFSPRKDRTVIFPLNMLCDKFLQDFIWSYADFSWSSNSQNRQVSFINKVNKTIAGNCFDIKPNSHNWFLEQHFVFPAEIFFIKNIIVKVQTELKLKEGVLDFLTNVLGNCSL